MSKTLRGLMIYTLVIAVIGAVVGFILLGVMFFTANTETPFKVFGYHVVSQREKRKDIVIDVSEFGERQNIVINNGGFPLVVVIDQTDMNPGIVVQKTDNVFGIVKEDYDPIIKTNVDEKEETVNIDIPALNGFVKYSNSLVKVILPAQEQNVYDLEINSDSGKILIDGKFETMKDGIKTDMKSRYIKISNLTVKTNTANFEILNINNLEGYVEQDIKELENEEEAVDVEENDTEELENEETETEEKVEEKYIPINFEKISLTTSTGYFNFSGIENLKVGRVYQNKVEINNEEIVEDEVENEDEIENEDEVENEEVVENESGTTNGTKHNFVLNKAKKTDIVFQNLYSPFEVYADDIRVEAKSINPLGEMLNFNSKKGYFNIGKIVLNENSINKITAERTNIKINEIIGGFTTINTTFGNITVGKITGGADIKSTEGNVHIAEATEVLEIENRIGEIKVDSYANSASFKNNKGATRATFAENGKENTLTLIETVSGRVVLNNIAQEVDIKSTGRANITVSFVALKPSKENIFNLDRGSLNLNLPAGNAFAITFSGQLSNVNGTIAGTAMRSELKENTKVSFFAQNESGSENHLLINSERAKVNFKEII